MKRIISSWFAVLMCLVAFSSCGTENSEGVNSELESLRAENEELKQQISETETTSETTILTTTESTTEATTVPTRTEEEIKSIICIERTSVQRVNSAGGVDLRIYWRNNSDKEIKYITFNVVVLNAVDDILIDEISGDNMFACRVTGPIEPTANKVDEAKTDSIDAMQLYYNGGSIILDDEEFGSGMGLCYCGADLDPNTGVRVRYPIPEEDYDKLTIAADFETVMYNSDASWMAVDTVAIEYMDGTSTTLNFDEVLLAFSD